MIRRNFPNLQYGRRSLSISALFRSFDVYPGHFRAGKPAKTQPNAGKWPSRKPVYGHEHELVALAPDVIVYHGRMFRTPAKQLIGMDVRSEREAEP
jgi:hypothetical protein